MTMEFMLGMTILTLFAVLAAAWLRSAMGMQNKLQRVPVSSNERRRVAGTGARHMGRRR